jgi:hypothetical protein
MKTTVNMQRRAARAMKQANHQGVDPRNTVKRQGQVYKRLCHEDIRRKPWTMSDAINEWGEEKHVHHFDDEQRCECGAFFF